MHRARSYDRWAQVGGIVLLLGCLAGWLVLPNTLHAQVPERSADGATIYEIDEGTLYFEATGHFLTNDLGFRDYWASPGKARFLGAPVTEVLTETGLLVQYFERGRLEYHPDLPGSPVLPGRIGADYAAELWQRFEAAPPHMAETSERFFEETRHTLNPPFLRLWKVSGELSTLGYPISEPLWQQVGNQMTLVQYFERGRLEHHTFASGTPDEVQISSLGLDLALLRGHDTTPVPAPVSISVPEPERQPAAPAEEVITADVAPAEAELADVEPADVEAADTAEAEAAAGDAAEAEAVETTQTDAEAAEEAELATLFQESPEIVPANVPPPEPLPNADDLLAAPPIDIWSLFKESPPAEEADWEVVSSEAEPTNKSLLINLSHQWLYAYEGDTLVFDAPVSTGRAGFDTPTGLFSLYARNPVQTMSGNLNGESYEVPFVTYAMYIHEDFAMHGAYWHNDFGTGIRRSHGCINLPVNSAAWVYRWAPLGTPVRVTH